MGKPILLVVSPRQIASLIAINLRRAGCDVIAAGSGAEGLHKAEEDGPEFVLAQPTMPDMDGTEFLRRLRANQATRGIPVVLLTDVAHVAAVFVRRGVDPDRAWNAAVRLRRLFARRSGR